MVKALGEKGIERIFACVPPRAMAAIVAQGNGFGERNVQSKGSCDTGGYLSDFERMGETGALVVVGEYKDLGLARKSAKSCRVKDAVSIALKACSPWIGRFIDGAIPGSLSTSSSRDKENFFAFLSGQAVDTSLVKWDGPKLDRGGRITVCRHDGVILGKATHRRRPQAIALGSLLRLAHVSYSALPL